MPRKFTSFFIRAEHWQIFLILLGAYLASEIAFIFVIALEPISLEQRSVETLLIIGAIGAVPIALSLRWFWSMGTFLNFLLRPQLRLSYSFFQFSAFLPVIYCTVFAPLVVKHVIGFYGILPLHLFVMFCLIYAIRFVGKNLRLTDEWRFLTFQDYWRYFLLLWFWPIGIWWIQPKINRLYAIESRKSEISPVLESTQ